MTAGTLPSITSPFRQKLGGWGEGDERGSEQGVWGGHGGRLPASYLKSMAPSPMSIPTSSVDSSRSMMAPSS